MSDYWNGTLAEWFTQAAQIQTTPAPLPTASASAPNVTDDEFNQWLAQLQAPSPTPDIPAPPAYDPSVRVYALLGHGSEAIVTPSERNVVPPGVTLVTVTACGQLSYDHVVERLIDILMSLRDTRPDIIRNPREHLAEIQPLLEYPIHVYKPGDRYPALLYTSNSFFGDPYYEYELSGVVDVDTLDQEDAAFTYTHVAYAHPPALSDEEYAIAYRKSVFPTPDVAPTEHLESAPVRTVFDNVGPGVYYFTACRYIDESTVAPQTLSMIRQFSEEQQSTSTNGGKRKRHLTKRRNGRSIKYRKSYK